MKCLRLFATAALAFAAGTAAAQSGLYVYAGAGAANPKFDEAEFGLGGGIERKTDSTDTSYHLGAGYRFNPHWAVELGVAHLGKYSIDYRDFVGDTLTRRYEILGFKSAVVGNVGAATDRFFFFGKLGIATTKVENESTLTLGGISTDFKGDKRRNSLLWGAGFQYNLTPRIGARAEYESWGEVGNDSDTGTAKMATWNILGVFSF